MGKRKTIGKLKADLDKVFNRYIRLRDCDNGYGTCIATGEGFRFEDLDAGHFFAKQGYDSLRYDEDNVHAESINSNRFDESHLIGYQDNLRIKIGEERLESLKERAREYKKGFFKWDRSEIEDKIIYYKEKLKEYE